MTSVDTVAEQAPSVQDGPLLAAEAVSRVFETAAGPVVALAEATLEVHRGELVVIKGRSGSGKTTLLNVLSGLDRPTSGRVVVDGVEVGTADETALVALRRRSVGFVFQSFGLIPVLSAAENVEVPLRLLGTPHAERDARVAELLERVGLAAHARQRPTELSGGQQQRVGVARGLAVDPNILLMDEPFGAVDPIVRDDLQNELLRLQRDLGKTVLFVTHDIDEAFRLGDQVVIFRKGGIVAQKGTPAEILASPADDFVASFVGADRGKRALHIEQTPTGSVLVDSEGRTAGVLSSEPSPDRDSKAAAVSVAGGADAVTQGGAPPRLTQ